jgi:DNA-binding NarL/FixJ family response regulator
MAKEIRVILVDDHKLFRDGLKFVLSQIEYLKVIAEASDGKEFLDILDNEEADLVLMDISMPKIDGIEATARAIEKCPDLKIIALSMFCDEEYYYKMIQAGVKGFILKESGTDELQKAIETVIDGESYFSQKLLTEIIANMANHSGPASNKKDQKNITKREFDVLKLICTGLSNSEIAERLFISTRTVEGHKTSLIEKTGVRNSISLVLYAIKNDLVEL